MAEMLLVWEMVPDQTRLYRLKCGTEIAELAINSAGKYINGDELPEDHDIFKLNDMLENMDYSDVGEIANGPFMMVVVCGFFC